MTNKLGGCDFYQSVVDVKIEALRNQKIASKQHTYIGHLRGHLVPNGLA